MTVQTEIVVKKRNLVSNMITIRLGKIIRPPPLPLPPKKNNNKKNNNNNNNKTTTATTNRNKNKKQNKTNKQTNNNNNKPRVNCDSSRELFRLRSQMMGKL